MEWDPMEYNNTIEDELNMNIGGGDDHDDVQDCDINRTNVKDIDHNYLDHNDMKEWKGATYRCAAGKATGFSARSLAPLTHAHTK